MLKDKYLSAIQAQLHDGEQIKVAEICQVKRTGKEVAARIAKDVATSLITAPLTGYGLITVPRPFYLAITNQRFLLFFQVSPYKKVLGIPLIKEDTVGDLAIDAPLEAVDLQATGGSLKGIDVVNNATGEVIAELNFGINTRAQQAILAQVQ